MHTIDMDEMDEDLETSRYPELETFFADGLIADVLHVVKSGKEATVLCCAAGPSAGAELLAAKVYRSRQHRSFRNDAVYQEGRVITESRARRAFKNKSRKGREVQSAGWIHAEWETLELLHAAGAAVPRPYAEGGSAILMEYVGDAGGPAPPLHAVSLEREEAHRLFERLTHDIELWLGCDRIHADLSAYNILYREGALTVIDFPQAVDPRTNPNALPLLERDLENVCAYFARQGVRADPQRIARHMWGRFLRGSL